MTWKFSEPVLPSIILQFFTHNLVKLFIAINAQGEAHVFELNAIYPANRELPRLILPHDHFGSHLDAARRSIDDDLEITNFDFAGQVLCDILPHTTLRNYLG